MQIQELKEAQKELSHFVAKFQQFLGDQNAFIGVGCTYQAYFSMEKGNLFNLSQSTCQGEMNNSFNNLLTKVRGNMKVYNYI